MAEVQEGFWPFLALFCLQYGAGSVRIISRTNAGTRTVRTRHGETVSRLFLFSFVGWFVLLF